MRHECANGELDGHHERASRSRWALRGHEPDHRAEGILPLAQAVRTRRLLLVLAIGLAGQVVARAAADHGAIATVQPVATDVAAQTMKQGGNAIDAAVAAALTLGVV